MSSPTPSGASTPGRSAEDRSTLPRATSLEDGRITSPVRGANLIGNGPQILAAIDAVAEDFETRDGVCGKEGQGAPVSNGSPTLRIARMTVGGTVA